MTHFPSVSDAAGMLGAMRLNPAASKLLVEYHTVVMRGPSALSPGERELIAAFVSGLNACAYCHGVHEATAHAFGQPPELIAKLVGDPDEAAAPEKLRPILKLARKLTLDQARVVRGDTQAVLSAGWDERALHDAINVIALFNFMNRYVHGHGLTLAGDELAERGRRLMLDGYDRLAKALDEEAASGSRAQ